MHNYKPPHVKRFHSFSDQLVCIYLQHRNHNSCRLGLNEGRMFNLVRKAALRTCNDNKSATHDRVRRRPDCYCTVHYTRTSQRHTLNKEEQRIVKQFNRQPQRNAACVCWCAAKVKYEVGMRDCSDADPPIRGQH